MSPYSIFGEITSSFLIFLFINKDNVIWIPRKSYYNFSNYSPKHKICNEQFTKKIGNVKPSAKIEQRTLEDDDDLYNAYCNLATQEDELLEFDEYIPMDNKENRSLPVHVHNYITKNFLEINSFYLKKPAASNSSSRYSSPKINERSYLSSSKNSSFSKQHSNNLALNKISNDEQSIFTFQEDDIKSEPLFNKNNNSVNECSDERQFYSHPISNFAKNKNKDDNNQYKNSIKNIHSKSNDNSTFKAGQNVSSTHIVASLLKSNLQNTQYIMIYFHSNGEDIITCYELVNHLRKSLNVNSFYHNFLWRGGVFNGAINIKLVQRVQKQALLNKDQILLYSDIPIQKQSIIINFHHIIIHVLTVEYPGYSYYEGNPNSEQILQDAQDVYYYVTEVMKVAPEKIIILGRSIGSGPATYLASQKKIGCLSLVSPFTSIRDLVKDKVGSLFQYLIQDRFNNLENIKNVKCPTFISHGQKDSLIQTSHSKALFNNCQGICDLVLPKEMNHNQLDFSNDLSVPFSKFLLKNNIKINQTCSKNSIQFPEYLFQDPKKQFSSQFINEQN